MRPQVNNAVEAIKLAYLSHAPIVWLVTNDKEVASEVAEAFTIDHFGAFRSSGTGRPVLLRDFAGNSASSIKKPSVFYKWYSASSNESESTSLFEAIEKFVSAHARMATDANTQTMDDNELNAVHLSIAIIASTSIPPESWLSRYIEIIYVKALDDNEIREAISETLNLKGILLKDKERINQMVVNLRGVSIRQITTAINRCVLSGFFDSTEPRWSLVFREIRSMKRQMMEGFIGLKWIDVRFDRHNDTIKSNQTNVSESLEVISKWLDERRDLFRDTEKAVKLGYDIPKGVLITGVPGTGKSMMAKETAKKLRLPLISLDMGDLQEGLVGASEKHLVDALRMVEAMAPCVLWIDEIEKAFSGSNSGSSDGGVMRRMFGKFLTWMQEKTAPCFVFATSNDISYLPPELFRSERFDEKFYSFMPLVDECSAIFARLIQEENKRHSERNPDDENCCLFSVELEKSEVWKDFLNSYSSQYSINMSDNKWIDGKVPQYKLFTGADISMLVKLIKFKLIKQYENAASNFSQDLVFKTTRDILCEFMPYGQTNLRDIAGCFIRLSRNRFKSASASTVICFDDFDSDKVEMSYNPYRYRDDYNKALYSAVVGAVNFYGKDIQKEIRRNQA